MACAFGGCLAPSFEFRFSAFVLMQLTGFWHWLTTTRYTRLLEERVARLEAENTHLRNAIYARAGVGPVMLGTTPGARPEPGKKVHQPLRRPISWIQLKQKLESAGSIPAGKRAETS
jgi:hypothetical protein